MPAHEIGVVFECQGDALVGVISLPAATIAKTGVLVIVGGPQYRAGSHRQFVLLCRHLADEGIPSLRFDYRGMGDSFGDQRNFEAIDADLSAAIDALFSKVLGMDRVVLWGLCDAASAACFYAPTDPRVAGLVLLNPWVRTERSEAKTYLKHYYLRRPVDPTFWRLVLTRKFSIRSSVKSLLAAFWRAGRRPGKTEGSAKGDLPTRMASCLENADLPVLIVLSGLDYVAREFEDTVRASSAWSRPFAVASVKRLDAADHTFSRAEWRDSVACATSSWILAHWPPSSCPPGHHGR